MGVGCLIEPVSRAGRVDLEKIVGQVQQADLHPITILVREFAQNSWDARNPDNDDPVRFEVDGFELDPLQLMALNEEVFVDLETSGVTYLSRFLLSRRHQKVRALVLSDWNTIGLEGVTDPRVVDPHHPEGKSAWTSYLHDIGAGQSVAAGHGGRYGMGRTSAYGVSKLRTIIVYTRTRLGGAREESRLIAVSIGGKDKTGDTRLTGRVWWGDVQGELAHPIVGSEADRIATSIGFKIRKPGDLGLSVMVLEPSILDPTTNEGTFEHAMHLVADGIMWNLWPKYETAARSMEFTVRLNGKVIPVPSPNDHPILREFVDLGKTVRRWGKRGRSQPRSRSGLITIHEIKYYNDLLGYLALKPFATQPDPSVDEERLRQLGGIAAPASHVLLMRSPELVVDYLKINAPVEAPTNVIGMFIPINVDAVDEAFALAEPVAHDRWQLANIPEDEETARGYVRTALRKLEQHFQEFVRQHAPDDEDDTEAEFLERSSRTLTQYLMPPRKQGSKGSTGGGTTTVGDSKAGQVVCVGSKPEYSKGSFSTLWIGEWRPKRVAPGPVRLRLEARPVGQNSNRVQPAESNRPEIVVDRLLEIVEVTADANVTHISREIVELDLSDSSKSSVIELRIGRSETVGVELKVTVGVDT